MMKYVISVENGGKPVLVNSKMDLNIVVNNIEEGPGIICTAWSKDTPANVMATISEAILGREKSLLVGLCCIADGVPLDEALWKEFEKTPS